MTASLDLAYSQCERIAKNSGSNFFLAFQLLSRQKYREMCALYAFMRKTDDLGDDLTVPIETRLRQLHNWREQLARALHEKESLIPELRTIIDLVERRHLNPAYLYAVIDGVESDFTFRGFESFTDLEIYCYQVAGAVGLCCLPIWGYEGEEPKEPAIACGTAFQLTNILRDLGEDIANGRVYLPKEDLNRFGYQPHHLAANVVNEPFMELMSFEAGRARKLYRTARSLSEHLSSEGRIVYQGLFDLYESLLNEIERRQFAVFKHRISVPKLTKARIAGRCLFQRGLRVIRLK